MVNLTALFFALAASAFAALCAVSDGALLAIDPSGDVSPRVRALHERRERVHRALAFARLVGQVVSGAAVAAAFNLGALSPGVRFFIVVIAAFAIVGISEGLARSIGDTLGAAAAARCASFIVAVERLLAPVVALGAAVDHGLQALLPPPEAQQEDREAVAERFRQVVAAEADVTAGQEVLLHGVFELGDTEVHEIMVPRVDIVAVSHDEPWSQVVDRVRSTGHARVPVYRDTIDDVIGILFAKDLLPWVLDEHEPPNGWDTLLRPAVFIPGTKKAEAQLRDFQSSGMHIAIVVDEFGGTAGLITIEDVLEEIVGDIRDEYDEEEAQVRQEGDDRYWVSARLTLDELSDVLSHDLRRDDLSTVGGLVYEHLGRVPRAGEEFWLDGFRVVVERVVRRRVQRVYFERVSHGPEATRGESPVGRGGRLP